MGVYRRVVRPVLFRADPEWIHDRSIRLAGWAGFAARAMAPCFATDDDRLKVTVGDLRFSSPLGLAAGFDKSARAVPFLAALGFSHVEVGSVSARPSAGNPRPRLFRLPAQQGIIVNYGLPNDGADQVATRLAKSTAPVGVNVVNTNYGPDAPEASDDEILDDYVHTVTRLQDLAGYLCLNLSCPNTRDGRGFFQDQGRLRALLDRLADLGVRKPLFLKVAANADFDPLLATATEFGFVTGFAVNLAPGKPQGVRSGHPGAVSGKPAEPAADKAIRDLYRRIDPARHTIIGSGGVFTAADAYRKLRLGATLVQLLTSLVYEGPGIARSITRGLPDLLARDGFQRVSEVVGVDA
ncbi:quinone-dependent dihydroorotate dehydrogenase [Actinocrispum sp. NPDC049592]|uniref:quinone-dependent dihydroorotate dehydrogenase n=1 Tax=Actinocrispum sp. NPDC049592 TaxID=3154835 RepID=UPI003419008E